MRQDVANMRLAPKGGNYEESEIVSRRCQRHATVGDVS
jgi:hypothetical protein